MPSLHHQFDEPETSPLKQIHGSCPLLECIDMKSAIPEKARNDYNSSMIYLRMKNISAVRSLPNEKSHFCTGF